MGDIGFWNFMKRSFAHSLQNETSPPFIERIFDHEVNTLWEHHAFAKTFPEAFWKDWKDALTLLYSKMWAMAKTAV